MLASDKHLVDTVFQLLRKASCQVLGKFEKWSSSHHHCQSVAPFLVICQWFWSTLPPCSWLVSLKGFMQVQMCLMSSSLSSLPSAHSPMKTPTSCSKGVLILASFLLWQSLLLFQSFIWVSPLVYNCMLPFLMHLPITWWSPSIPCFAASISLFLVLTVLAASTISIFATSIFATSNSGSHFTNASMLGSVTVFVAIWSIS